MANSGYFVKNAEDVQKLDTTPQEGAVIKQVAKEINALGDNIKANYEELNKKHEELKSFMNSLDGKFVGADQLEKIKKLTEDISTRQAALDETTNKRMDSLEVAFQRIGNGNSDSHIDLKGMDDFFIAAASVTANGKGVGNQEIEEIKKKRSANEFEAYSKAFNKFLRTNRDKDDLDPAEKRAMSVGVDPDGGYTVTPVMSNTVITRLYEMSPIRQLVSVESITTGAIEWMADWDQAGYGWEEETVGGSETDTPQLNKIRISVHVMYAKPRASQVLLEDSGINAESWLANKVADRFNRIEGASFVSGNGIGKPRGFLVYTNGTSFGNVEQVAMGAGAALTADGFISVKYALIEQYLNRGTWLMSRSSVAAAMKLKDGNGNYIWSPGLTTDNTSTILGLPVRMATDMPTIAADALSVALADWKSAYMIVDRLGITIQRDPFTVKPMVEFYTRKRVGGGLVNGSAIKIGKISA